MSDTRKKFILTIERSKKQIYLYNRLRNVRFVKTPKRLSHNDLSDILRASIVLSVSAMDAYFTNKFVDIIIPYLKKKKPTRKLIELLGKAGLNVEQSLRMINMDRPWRRIRTLMDSHLEKYTTQRADTIDELFGCFGINDFTNNAQGIVKDNKLLKRIGKIVERRHQIVHDGDLNSYGKMRNINVNDVSKYIEDIELLIKGSEELCIKSRLTTG